MPFYHVCIIQKSNHWHDEVRLDLTSDKLRDLVLEPYGRGMPITSGGKSIPTDDIERIKITRTEQDSAHFRPAAELKQRRSMVIPPIPVNWYISEMGEDVTDEFITGPPGSRRDEPSRVRMLQSDSDNAPPQGKERTLVARFDEFVTQEALKSTSRQLFSDGHYSRAVEEAFKRLNNEVKHKSGCTDRDGADLMHFVFSAGSPVLRFNALQTQSEKDEQLGYMEIFAGALTGIRNPRAHEHELVDDPEVALEMLVLANHLMRKLESAT